MSGWCDNSMDWGDKSKKEIDVRNVNNIFICRSFKEGSWMGRVKFVWGNGFIGKSEV